MKEKVQLSSNKINTRIDAIGHFNGVDLFVKRDDLIDPMISGNKLYKLELNLQAAIRAEKSAVLTFGGAFSNHIAATASACEQVGLKSIGVIRGEASSATNPTLTFARQCGMELVFVSRADYALKEDPEWLRALSERMDRPFIIPEGGANRLGVEGARQMLNEQTSAYSHIVCAVGTGTTVAGLALNSEPDQTILGMVIHRHKEILSELGEQMPEVKEALIQVTAVESHFGGYAKWNTELVEHIQAMWTKFGLKLDPIYTGKAMLTTFKMIEDATIPSGSRVLFIHTGGLQGVSGFEERHGVTLHPVSA